MTAGYRYPNANMEKCARCGWREEDHGEVCRVCRDPIEAHMVHHMGHRYDEVRFVSCVELPFGIEFEAR